jgi:hypothetical protein
MSMTGAAGTVVVVVGSLVVGGVVVAGGDVGGGTAEVAGSVGAGSVVGTGAGSEVGTGGGWVGGAGCVVGDGSEGGTVAAAMPETHATANDTPTNASSTRRRPVPVGQRSEGDSLMSFPPRPARAIVLEH